MAAERRIKSLKLRLRSIETSFSLIRVFVDNFREDTQSIEVPVRLENLGVLWADFCKTQAELEAAEVDDPEVIDLQLKQRAQFETEYYRVKGFLLSVNKNNSAPCIQSSQSSAHFPASSQIRLPDVKLPVFNGTLEHWLNFHDLFISLVHSSSELSNIQKFYYLRSSLAGDALKLIQTIGLSANNYPVAWNLLVEHFQNPSRLKQAYIDSLFEFTPLKRESATDLHSLVEKFEANVRILKQLGERTEYWDVLLIRMLSIRLDAKTRRDWEEFASTHEATTFPDLVLFLQRRVTVLQSVSNVNLDTPSIPASKKPVYRAAVVSNGATQVSFRQCHACSEHHPLYQCSVFSKMTTEDKEKLVRRQQLCRNCLRKGHQARTCQSKNTCRKCRGKHHSQICSQDSVQAESNRSKTDLNAPKDPIPTGDECSSSLSAAVQRSPSGFRSHKVLLATAVINLVDDRGNTHPARALLDSGSECSFITEALSQKLKVQRNKVHLAISGIGQSSVQARCKLRATVHSRITEFSTVVELFVLPKLTLNLPSTTLNISKWNVPKGIRLADPVFYESHHIDVVLGADIFFELFKTSGRVPLGDSLPTLVNSVLGWVVSGKVSNFNNVSTVASNVATVADVYRLMQRFWAIEEDDSASCLSVEEAACENHFRRTVRRNSEGRYIVRLPLKEADSRIGDNRSIALRRFHMLEARLQQNSDLRSQYQDFMAEYLALGHMRRVDEVLHSNPQYYLPHHAVIRADSATTKVRVVFDASCKSSTGKSLNDALMVGPVIQDDLRAIILRTRINPVLLIADIKQMYRQILVDERDTPLQRILWRNSPDKSIGTFELKTVTYGTASAPFLATRTLQQLADDEKLHFPEGSKVLRKDVYVDDLVTSGSSPDEVTKIRNQLDQLCKRGGFEFRKFASNVEAVLDGISPERRALQSSVELAADQCIKTLGLHWEPSTDNLRFRIQVPDEPHNTVMSKRIALSQIAQLFDPLGLVGPVIVTAKIFMQTLWSLNSDDGKPWGWDQPLPASLASYWENYTSQLPSLSQLRIPRCIVVSNFETVQLHLFSDASEQAYGACAYFRSTDTAGNIAVGLLTAKSKVAPLKKRSIPRLELCGALEAAQLSKKISFAFGKTFPTFFWVDSTTVLAWLRSTPSNWTTFVANRVSKIQLATEGSTWNHVAGQQNPADHISRGIDADTLLACDLWWQGPEWLRSDQSFWPASSSNHTFDTQLEYRTAKSTVLTATIEPTFIDAYVARFSKFQTMLRVTAFCLRFSLTRRSPRNSRTFQPFLTSDEIRDAEHVLIRLVQAQEFSDYVAALEASKPTPVKSRLRWFTPFLDSSHLMRIGGRIDRSSLTYDAKHQILLPYQHRFSILLVECYHERHLHAAPQLLLGILRLRYWIIGARNLAKTVVHRCVICVRARPKLVEQFMAELPRERITATRPFTKTGVDYWGPILLKPPQRRAAPTKAFVAIFVCFSTKAVHIELVFDLTTAKFLQALRRFVSRRGPPSDMYSDNGRNFLGARNELKRLLKNPEYTNTVAAECTDLNIRWHFNPPRASHFGGLWESAINSAQKHFLRVVRDRPLAYDDMDTLLCQIECCLNSRPIVPLSDDPTDYEPLTPGHFLVGTALKSVPDENHAEVPFNYLRKWQQTQKLFQDIWRRWHLEYLATLEPRARWCNSPVSIQQNQLVLLKDDATPPIRWPTARVAEIHPGKDGITRVVTLQTPKGYCTRPVAKICLLPIASTPDESKPTAGAEQSTPDKIFEGIQPDPDCSSKL
ncbi:uncharacterized protein LOC129741794 [Uranotaenia lowii]|uniref:uncharacterized protein LOC129741794 n=1 Tax=Uranotaenia lowii TaxID=190385 RepID=UPI00247869AD|nr:uncharacterized protein LOC129741794 [Uranotaenia lowii]